MTDDRPKLTNFPKVNPDLEPRDVFVMAEHYENATVPWHAHRRAQLIYATEGVLTVRTEEGLWVVPPQRAVWVLPGVAHQLSSDKPFCLRTLYAEPGAMPLPKTSSVVFIDVLVRELFIAASAFGGHYETGSAEENIIKVIIDRLPQLEVTPLSLKDPRDQRLRKITDRLRDNPTLADTLEDMAKEAGLTERTAARLFQKETDLTFGAWRQQLRLLMALQKLGAGESVTNVAFDVGYQDVSAFIAMFKAALGKTPAHYFE